MSKRTKSAKHTVSDNSEELPTFDHREYLNKKFKKETKSLTTKTFLKIILVGKIKI